MTVSIWIITILCSPNAILSTLRRFTSAPTKCTQARFVERAVNIRTILIGFETWKMAPVVIKVWFPAVQFLAHSKTWLVQ